MSNRIRRKAEAGTGNDPGGVPGDPVKVNLISLGCAKNLVDSEVILGNAGTAGLAITPRPEDADVIVINTCGFIDPARQESLGAIRDACEVKRASRNVKKIAVVGCLAQKSADEIRRLFPGIDAILGFGEYGRIGELLRSLAKDPGAGRDGGPRISVSSPDLACTADVGRFRLTPRHYAYLRISEGCDNPCTFCTIPAIRGRFRSKPLGEIEREARELAASGARELNVISQDTTSYGEDIDGRVRLPELLERLASVDGVRWIRVLYTYPASFTDEAIRAIAEIPRVVKYVDIPIQHIHDRMLRRMGRRMDEAGTRRLLEKLRERIPGLYLRTTFIVGFPGEGEEEFRRLLEFVREFRFERMGVFPYSREEGTPAARLGDDVPEEASRARREELMLAQQEVAFAQNRARRGEVCEALVDEEDRGELLARSHGEAPEIDPRIILAPRDPRGGNAGRGRRGAAGDPGREIGEFLPVEITGTRDYDLIARPLR